MSGSCQGAATLAATTPAPADESDAGACSGAESFALRVLGDDMAPEFNEGEIIIIEPDGALKDGSYVLAQVAGEWIFRQLVRRGAGWQLQALNAAYDFGRGLGLDGQGPGAQGENQGEEETHGDHLSEAANLEPDPSRWNRFAIPPMRRIRLQI